MCGSIFVYNLRFRINQFFFRNFMQAVSTALLIKDGFLHIGEARGRIIKYLEPLLEVPLDTIKREDLLEGRQFSLTDRTGKTLKIHGFVLAILIGISLKGIKLSRRAIDAFDNTFSHYRALVGERILDNSKTCNRWGWTPIYLKSLLQRPIKVGPSGLVSRPVIYPERLLALWLEQAPPLFLDLLPNGQQRPPEELLDIVPDTKFGSGSIALASRTIDEKECFSPYYGEVLDPHPFIMQDCPLLGIEASLAAPVAELQEYTSGLYTNASSFKSPASYVPDGTPRVSILFYERIKMFECEVLKALERINKGQIITGFFGLAHPVRTIIDYKIYNEFDLTAPSHAMVVLVTPALFLHYLPVFPEMKDEFLEEVEESIMEKNTGENEIWFSYIQAEVDILDCIQTLNPSLKALAINYLSRRLKEVLLWRHKSAINPTTLDDEVLKLFKKTNNIVFFLTTVLNNEVEILDLLRDKEEQFKLLSSLQTYFFDAAAEKQYAYSSIRCTPCFCLVSLDGADIVHDTDELEEKLNDCIDSIVCKNPLWEALKNIDQVRSALPEYVLEEISQKIATLKDGHLEGISHNKMMLIEKHFTLDAYVNLNIKKPEYLYLLKNIEEELSVLPTIEELDRAFSRVSEEQREELMRAYEGAMDRYEPLPKGCIDIRELAKVIRNKIYHIMVGED